LTANAKFCSQCGAVATPAKQQPGIPEEISERAVGFTGRLWVLSEVLDWIDHGSERFFMITGEPGSGKTALAAWLAGAGDAPASEELKRMRDCWKAMHFCVADDKHGSLNPGRFAQSLARQLAEHYDDYALAVLRYNAPTINISLHARENWGRMVGAQLGPLVIDSNFEDIYHRAVREPLVDLYDHSVIDRTYILVDALDEAYRFGSTNIVTLLAGSNDLPAGVRFLLTSRRDSDITKKFKSVRRLDLSGRKHGSETDNDIRVYVTQRLSEQNIRKTLNPGLELKTLEDDLVTRAAGNFLYVKFLLDEVAKESRSLGELGSLPRGLYSLYSSYLDRLVPETSTPGSSLLWREQYQPLLGCLSVALPAAPHQNLHLWMKTRDEHINGLLGDVMQITEYDQEYGGAYRLYHRSMAEFLAAREYMEEEEVELNKYHTPPSDQHDRIIQYYTQQFPKNCDHYALRQLITHIQTRWNLAEMPDEKEKLAQTIFDVVLNGDFRLMQRDKLGDDSATLYDLQAALNIALEHDQLIKALACVGAYQSTLRDPRLLQDLFESITKGDFKRALQLAAYYTAASSPKGTWAKVLHLYLAWEAATAGDVDSAIKAATSAQDLPVARTGRLCDALLAHTAHVLAGRQASGSHLDAASWLDRLSPGHSNAQRLLDIYKVSRPIPLEEQPQAFEKLDELISRMAEMADKMGAELDPEKNVQFGEHSFDPEGEAAMTSQMGDVLTLMAAEAGVQNLIERLLLPALSNPYPQSRDMGLVAISSALLSVPDPSFVRSQMQRTLKATLDKDVLAFTFDLPCVLLTEAVSRNMPAPELSDYFDRAYNCIDLWGTRMSARSARATALFRQGDKAGAFAALDEAEQFSRGFSGYISIHLLSLINRRAEFGLAEGQDILLEKARHRAETVNDPWFKEQRVKLVSDYSSWMTESTGQLELEAVRVALSKINDPDTRRAYKDFVTARWAWPPEEAKWKELKALVPMTLTDTTTLDAVLGRLFGLRIKLFSDAELAEAIQICEVHLTTGRPWDLGK
jgi:hypothetical protein